MEALFNRTVRLNVKSRNARQCLASTVCRMRLVGERDCVGRLLRLGVVIAKPVAESFCGTVDVTDIRACRSQQTRKFLCAE